MMFKTELIDKILSGHKTQTRRPVKDEHNPVFAWGKIVGVCIPSKFPDTPARIVYGVSNDYAVCPGRGQPGIWYLPPDRPGGPNTRLPQKTLEGFGKLSERELQAAKPLRIMITAIFQQDVRQISEADVLAEGFQYRDEFLRTWAGFYDKQALTVGFEGRPDTLYVAWVLHFRICS